MSDVTTDVLDTLIQRLVTAVRPAAIHLFGSQATGETGPHSDIDLLIVVDDDAAHLGRLTDRCYRSISDLGVPVDFVLCRRRDMTDWQHVRQSLPAQALQHGRQLYARTA